MDIVVERREAKALGENWALIYGRRKVGKTFMLRRFYSWDYFALVSRDRSIWIDGADVERFLDMEDFVAFLLRALGNGKKVVIDEFQRLPEYVLERISTTHPSGVLLLSGSSMKVVDEILGKRSPLLGLLEEHFVDLIHPQDFIDSLNTDDVLDYLTYIRDPWLIPMMSGNSILHDLYRVVVHGPSTISSLIGEVFMEEDRKLTATYEGIIESIGSMHGRPAEIASLLYHRSLISKESPSAVVPYIRNLVKMGILKEVRLYGRKGVIYRMRSPIFSVFYYLRDKYDMEMRIPSFAEAEENLMRIHGLCYEDFIAGVMADVHGAYLRYSHEPEIDAIGVDRKNRPVFVMEVKHGSISKSEVSRFMDKTENIGGKRIVVARNRIEYEDVISLTPKDMEKMIREWKPVW